MMHPSRQAYVEEDEPEVSSHPQESRADQMFINVFQSCGGSLLAILAMQDQRDVG